MGTSYRSALSWDIETTTVELAPSVIEAFGFYHADTERILGNPKGHVIIDDGRRYLARVPGKFDVIVVDPPPPPEAAGSSLLYSDEFYELAKQRLNPGGIRHAWPPPGGDLVSIKAVLRSISDSFPHKGGIHITQDSAEKPPSQPTFVILAIGYGDAPQTSGIGPGLHVPTLI